MINQKFWEPMVTSSNALFCPTNSPKPKDIKFTIQHRKSKNAALVFSLFTDCPLSNITFNERVVSSHKLWVIIAPFVFVKCLFFTASLMSPQIYKEKLYTTLFWSYFLITTNHSETTLSIIGYIHYFRCLLFKFWYVQQAPKGNMGKLYHVAV